MNPPPTGHPKVGEIRVPARFHPLGQPRRQVAAEVSRALARAAGAGGGKTGGRRERTTPRTTVVGALNAEAEAARATRTAANFILNLCGSRVASPRASGAGERGTPAQAGVAPARGEGTGAPESPALFLMVLAWFIVAMLPTPGAQRAPSQPPALISPCTKREGQEGVPVASGESRQCG